VKVSQGETSKETATIGDLSFARPNKVSIEVMGGKIPFTLVSNGAEKTTLIPALGGYTIEETPSSFSDFLIGVGGNLLRQQIPIATVFFSNDPYRFFVSETVEIEYLGSGTVDGIACHRLGVTEPTSKMELWIDEGEKAVIRRVLPDTSSLESQLALQSPGIEIEMRIEFRDWVVGEELPEGLFAFTPPEWAEKRDSFLTSAPRQDAAMELIGKAAPDLQVSLLDGSEFDLKASRGKDIVILDFWATWCGPCVMALPVLAEVAELYREKGVIFIAVNIEGIGPAVVREFLDARELDIKAGVDTDQEIASRYRVGPIPQTVIVDKDGLVQTVHLGHMPNLKEVLSEQLDALLAGRDLYN
jgi:thiol-disulfide isomerase/thioredoxin